MPQITPEQWKELLTILTKIADKPYTITGAADWAMLQFISGLLFAVGCGLLGVIWYGQWRVLSAFKHDNEREHEAIWDAQEICQDRCCQSLVTSRKSSKSETI